jgi:rhodanese-related sulfurtransferase
MNPREITPMEAAALVKSGALLVDVREMAEREGGIIPGAAHAPLSLLDRMILPARPGQSIVFHCHSGGRTTANAAALTAKAPRCNSYLMKGGIEAWQAAGLPVKRP